MGMAGDLVLLLEPAFVVKFLAGVAEGLHFLFEAVRFDCDLLLMFLKCFKLSLKVVFQDEFREGSGFVKTEGVFVFGVVVSRVLGVF